MFTPVKLAVLVWQVCGVVEGGDIAGVGHNGTLTLAYPVSWSHDWAAGPYMGSAIVTGLREVERRQLLPGYHLEWVWGDSWCKPLRGTKVMVQMWSSVHDLDGIIGGACSTVCVPVSLLAAAWNIPVISYGCESSSLSDKTKFPTFTRVSGPKSGRARMLNALADMFGWTRIGIFTTTDASKLESAQATQRLMVQEGKQVFFHIMETTVDGDQINQDNLARQKHIVRLAKHEVRVIYIVMYPNDVRNFLISALDEGLLNGDYAFVAPDIGYLPGVKQTYRPEADHSIYNGVINRDLLKPSGPEYVAFEEEVLKDFQHPLFERMPHLPLTAHPSEVDLYAGMVHDAVLQWAYGVNKTLEQGHAPDDGVKVTQNIINLTYEGITGRIKVDQYGDRQPDQRLEIMQGGKVIPILDWLEADGKMVKLYKPDNPGDWSGLSWYGNPLVPKDTPECGWQNEHCDNKEDKKSVVTIAVTVVTVVLALVIIVLAIVLKRYRFEMALKEVIEMRVNWDDVDPAVLDLRRSHISINQANQSDQTSPIYEVRIGLFKGQHVTIHAMRSAVIDFSDRKFLLELKEVRNISHENLLPMVGLCADPPNECILMAYASRGSLQDIYQSDDFLLSWDFKLPFAVDIANGMRYLHRSSIGFHCQLSSRKCVVDSRWTCKITGFALREIRKQALDYRYKYNSTNNKAHLLWTAPELLRNTQNLTVLGMQKSDVYSYGIIIQELILEQPPYGGNHPPLSADVIVQSVTNRTRPICRPIISASACPSTWRDLMEQCWSENPNRRPSFSQIIDILCTLNDGKMPTVVDNMINNLERHTTHLEEEVTERTKDLLVEKHKVETLLCELLPTSVARKLTSGETPDPEAFENTTIYFSDIVGFTTIAAGVTPMHIVSLLNSMYTVFDNVTQDFDVFKVATIGDAYMVASGVPERNGDQHATEICQMALGLMDSVRHLSIPDNPDQSLQMRSGIHSGPCVGAVVGRKMPRYMLFGETVEISSRMESGGEAMKIHISESTKVLLHGSKAFKLKARGKVHIKNKGILKSYWLIGTKHSKTHHKCKK